MGSATLMARVLSPTGPPEKRTHSETVYEVSVRMDDGSLRTITQQTAPATGARVAVEGQTLRALNRAPAGAAEPRMVRTGNAEGV